MLMTLGLSFLIVLLLGMPVAFALGFGALIAFHHAGIPLQIIAQRFYNAINIFPLLAVPMFVLAGELMRRSGLVRGLLSFADALVGHFTGGLGQVNVLASMFFGGITGAAVADTSALGPLEIEMMTDAGYDKDFSVALTVASSSIGPIIPPSIPMVLYGVTTGVSIGALFLGGVVPGLLVGVGLLIGVYLFAKVRRFPHRDRMLPLREVLRGLRTGLSALGIPVIVIGGIIGGIVTPTEASALAVGYALLVGGVLLRNLSWQDIYDSIVETAITTAVVLMILGSSGAVSYIITNQQVAVQAGAWFSANVVDPWIFLLLINLLLLFVGLFLDTGAAIILFAPIIFPIAQTLGIDPVHFGVVVVFNLVLGLVTPPVGAVLFVGCSIGRIGLERLVRAVLPFFLIEVVVLLLITYVPVLVTFVPSRFGF